MPHNLSKSDDWYRQVISLGLQMAEREARRMSALKTRAVAPQKPLSPADNEDVLDKHPLEAIKQAPKHPPKPPYKPKIDSPPLAP